jgi:hypothetical protein
VGALEETIDYVAITRLQQRYADVANRRAWAELHELFLPDAAIELDLVTREPFELVGAQALGEFIGGSLERFEFVEFVILNVVLDIDGDTATGRIFMSELRRDVGTHHPSQIFGLYRDRYVRTPEGWRFAHRSYRSMARSDEAEVVALPSDL